MVAAPIAAQTDAVTITPFWQRIPRCFLFPFHVEPLLYTTFLAMASFLDLIVPHVFGVSVVEIGIALAVLRYAFRVVEQTSLGYLTPQEYQLEAALDTKYLPYKMFGILVLWGILEAATMRVSPTLGVFVSLPHDAGAAGRCDGSGHDRELRSGNQSGAMGRRHAGGRPAVSGALAVSVSPAHRRRHGAAPAVADPGRMADIAGRQLCLHLFRARHGQHDGLRPLPVPRIAGHRREGEIGRVARERRQRRQACGRDRGRYRAARCGR
jgi:hypothetical protein